MLNRLANRIADETGYTVEQIKGPSRSASLVKARDRFIKNARGWEYSLTEIGNFLGGRHHTTIMHALKKEAQDG